MRPVSSLVSAAVSTAVAAAKRSAAPTIFARSSSGVAHTVALAPKDSSFAKGEVPVDSPKVAAREAAQLFSAAPKLPPVKDNSDPIYNPPEMDFGTYARLNSGGPKPRY